MTNNNPEKNQKKDFIKQRKKSRRLVVQALYAWLLAKNNWQTLEQDFLNYNRDFDEAYFKILLRNTVEHFDALSHILQNYLDREFTDLDPVEQAILIMGAWELRDSIEIPSKVAINEAVELAKLFGATDSHKYVNGVLDKLAKEFRKNEF
ncbi:MAG: transcription antitermination factor NusB [Gammaproteobacteria bacterium]